MKQLPDKGIKAIAELLNIIWESGKIPKIWKKAVVVR